LLISSVGLGRLHAIPPSPFLSLAMSGIRSLTHRNASFGPFCPTLDRSRDLFPPYQRSAEPLSFHLLRTLPPLGLYDFGRQSVQTPSEFSTTPGRKNSGPFPLRSSTRLLSTGDVPCNPPQRVFGAFKRLRAIDSNRTRLRPPLIMIGWTFFSRVGFWSHTPGGSRSFSFNGRQ